MTIVMQSQSPSAASQSTAPKAGRGKPYRSKLRPFLQFIVEQRQEEATWDSIAKAITEQGTPTDIASVIRFYQRSQKGSKKPVGFPDQPEQPPQQ